MNDASKESDERNRVITTLNREYETLEKSFWVTVSFLLAVVAHLLYKDWYLTVGDFLQRDPIQKIRVSIGTCEYDVQQGCCNRLKLGGLK